jgi:tetratricopeptide (TPR) repeat protein
MRRAPVSGGTPSVLALPCKVFGAPEVAFLTDAVPGTISTLLSGVAGLDTKVPPSSLEVDKVKGDLGRLAELYQVSSFIVTSLTASPGRFALNVQLVDAATRKVRWGQQYDGPREAYNELARQAAEGIRQAVKPATAPVPAAGVSSEAELAFREGTYFSRRYNNFHDQHDFDLALAAFQRALELAPGLADAAGKIAMLYVFRFQSGMMPARESVPAVERWASQALAISPCSALALSALCAVELERPVQSTRRMVEYGLKAALCGRADGRAQFFLGYGAYPAGLTSVAIAAYLEAHRLDPLDVYAPLNAAFWLRGLGRPEEALRLLDQALTTEPGMPLLQLDRVATLVDLRRLAEAETVLRPLEARAEKSSFLRMYTPMIRSALSLAAGNRSDADAALAQVFSLIRSEQGTGLLLGDATGYVAPPLARQGRVKEAVDILERAAAVGAAVPYEFLMRNRDLASVRGDPRFPGILARSKVQFDEARGILEQARARGELPAYLHQPFDELVRLLKENEGRR